MPRVGLEPTIPEFEGAMTDHALGRGATVIGDLFLWGYLKIWFVVLRCIMQKDSSNASKMDVAGSGEFPIFFSPFVNP
jgi:hypothetical protein